jgi:hypothetical protein
VEVSVVYLFINPGWMAGGASLHIGVWKKGVGGTDFIDQSINHALGMESGSMEMRIR